MTAECLPLAGVRVIDMTEMWAGPMAASYLADWGAEVIRVESFPRSEVTRPVTPPPGGLGFSDNDPTLPLPWERHARRFVANHSKRGIAVNARDPRGRAILLMLCTTADIFIENYAAGTVERLGLGNDELRAVNPGLIMVSISGWGNGGPYAGYRATGSGVDATTGHAVLRGYSGDDPTETAQCYHSDALASLVGMLGAVSALYERRHTGRGRYIELSMAEVQLTTLARSVIDASLNGHPGTPLENDHAWAAPHGCYPCRGTDRWITIAVETDAQWAALCDLIDMPDLRTTRYATMQARWQHRAELNARLSAWTAGWDDHELTEALQIHGVPAGSVYNEWDAMDDPHLRARGFWVEADHPIVGRRTYPRAPWRLDGCEPTPYRPANRLGEDNAWALTTLLGMSPAEVERLMTDGVLGTSYG